jgi:hypothetical protein
MAVFASWVVVQLYYRVVVRFATMDQVFWFGVMSWCLIAVAPFVTLRFAQGQHGTRAATAAYVGVALAVVDLVGETLQFMPQLGLPALMPSDKGMTELVVRGLWVSCEFLMRSAVFVALWRCQVGAPRVVLFAFVGLVATHWVGAMISFLRVTEPYVAWWNGVPASAILVRGGWLLALTWMSLLVWLSYRVVTGRHSAVVQSSGRVSGNLVP